MLQGCQFKCSKFFEKLKTRKCCFGNPVVPYKGKYLSHFYHLVKPFEKINCQNWSMGNKILCPIKLTKEKSVLNSKLLILMPFRILEHGSHYSGRKKAKKDTNMCIIKK